MLYHAKRCLVRNSTITKRFLSKVSEEGQELEEVKDLVEKLGDRPFENFAQIEIPKKLNANLKYEMKQPNTFISPFLNLNYNDSLDFILKNKTNPAYTKYSNVLNFKLSTFSTEKNALDIITNYSTLSQCNLIVLKNDYNPLTIVFPDEAKNDLLKNINTNFENDNLMDIIGEFQSQTKYSFQNIVHLLVMLIPEIDNKKSSLLLTELNKLFNDYILEFQDHELENISHALLKHDQFSLVTTIMKSFDETVTGSLPFISRVSYPFVHSLLQSTIKANDFQSSKTLIEHLINEGYSPSSKTTLEYLKLIIHITTLLDSTKKNKGLLFNSFAEPLGKLLRNPKILTSEMISLISPFIKYHQLIGFLNYLKLNKLYLDIIPEAIPAILNRFSTSSNLATDDLMKALRLTSLLTHLCVSDLKLSDETKKQIIKLYANYKSPLAVKLWSDKLSIKLTQTEKAEILKLLKAEPSSRPNHVAGYDISTTI